MCIFEAKCQIFSLLKVTLFGRYQLSCQMGIQKICWHKKILYIKIISRLSLTIQMLNTECANIINM